MPGLEQYMTPIHPDARPDWLTMIRQGQQMPPDQAQINQSIQPPAPSISDVPMVQNFQAAPGLSNYLPPASRAIDRSIIDQYRDQSKRSVLEQEAGVSKLEDQSRELATQKSPVDWTAVASLVDSMNAQNGTKTNLYESALANRGLTPDQKQDKLLKFEEYIQGAKGAVSKEKLQALQQTLAMVHQNDQSDLMRAHYANMEKLTGDRNDIYGNRIQSGQELAAQRQMLNDPINKTYIPRLDGAVKIMDFIDGAERGEYKTNKAFLGQMNAEIARLETGSQSPGLNAGEKTEMTSQAAALRDVYDGISGGVTAVDLSKKIEQARGMVGNLGQSYRQQIEARNRVIAAGAQPAQAPIFAAKSQQWGKDFNDRVSKLSPKSAMALGVKPDIVRVSNGQETLDIPREHLSDALKDDYHEVK